MSPRRISLLAFVAAAASLVRLFYIHSLLGTGPVSIALQVAAIALMVWARATFGLRSFHAGANPTRGELVTRGPYAFVRNPIYSAVILFTWAGVAVHLSLESVLLGLVVAAGMRVRIHFEERLLREDYPEYADYVRRVKRLLPYVY